MSEATKIGTYHLQDNPQLYEIQRSNNFEFVVTDIDGILRPGTIGTEQKARFENAQEIIRMSVDTCTIPHYSQNPIEVRRGNSSFKFAGVPQFTSGQVTCNDYIGADTKVILLAWQNLSYNVYTEKVGLVSEYKKDCYLIEYDPSYNKVRQWILHGCWIKGMSETDFNSSGNDKHKITVQIEYDRAELDTSELV